jgi:two-component sensor histidine kinase
LSARIPTREEDAALSLTLAVVTSANSPLLLLDGSLNVVGVSASFRRAFETEAPTKRSVFSLGSGEWDVPQLRSFLQSAAAGRFAPDTQFELVRDGCETRQLMVHAEKLEYLDLNEVRLLMAVTDITEAKAADKRAEELRQRNAMLVQEARHRVANSLQLIASVLMQHARRTQSEETRTQLNSAHQRVMSVAALERHLAGSGEDRVMVRPYLVKLCDAIAASMIADGERVSLEVVGDDSAVEANVSVSLGLITTELVINAVKYAFPEGQKGKIVVRYQTEGNGWALIVQDDGVGLPPEVATVSGLGTSIIQALAMQLQALVIIDRAAAGTSVSIIHPVPRPAPEESDGRSGGTR